MSQISPENTCVGVLFRPATLLNRLRHWCFPVKFAKFLRRSTLKNICKRLIPFNSSQNAIPNSSGKFGLDKTLTDCKVGFIKQNNCIQSNAAISFIYKFKKCFFNI